MMAGRGVGRGRGRGRPADSDASSPGGLSVRNKNEVSVSSEILFVIFAVQLHTYEQFSSSTSMEN